MVEFKAVVADPRTGKAYQQTIKGHYANSLVGRKIGDEVDGIFVGLPGYKLVITGGTDKDGFPMRPDLHGARRKRIRVSYGIGYHPDDNGVVKRRTFCGNTISPDIVQVNLKITSYGAKPVDALLKGSSTTAGKSSTT